MTVNGYKLLGLLAWRGAKWSVRRRLPSAQKAAAGTAGLLAAIAAAVLLGRRLTG
jgi:hypothetical protein